MDIYEIKRWEVGNHSENCAKCFNQTINGKSLKRKIFMFFSYKIYQNVNNNILIQVYFTVSKILKKIIWKLKKE